jgi:hypothetical protein
LILERPTPEILAFAQDDKAFIVVPSEPFMFVVPKGAERRRDLGFALVCHPEAGIMAEGSRF